MLKPVRLLFESLQQFALGIGPGIVMAFVCLAIQVADSIPYSWLVSSPPAPAPAPAPDFDEEWLNNIINNAGRVDWREAVDEVASHTTFMAGSFFFHALVALMLTSWLLRRRAGFDRERVLRRALLGAGLLTVGMAVVYAAAYAVDNVLPATRYVRFNFDVAAMIGIWFGCTALLLPARLMGHEPAIASGWLKPTLIAAIALLPWFFVSEIVGRPLRHCRECGGFFEGGLVFWPLLGGYLLSLTVASAAVSAAACLPADSESATAPV